jgi:tRNA U34 5-methylaminomethyl-2-thiouridine-forming methyltransferase MnmC
VAGQQAELEWRDGVPVSTRFADPYYSLENGLAETRHVFLAGNGLPERLRPGFHVAELGVGTGLNLLALLALVRTTGRGPIRYTGFEAFPMRAADMRAALAAFPEVAADARALAAAWEAGPVFRTPEIEARFVFGDARDTLPGWTEKADAWFLDGFAPARNPELWEPALLAEVARHTAEGGTAATYSAAGEVRRSLAAAGFAVERRAGYGRKRHMTVARLP